MKILVLGATGATGQLIVRDAAASGHSVVALVRAKARSDLPGAELIEGDARDEGTLARALDGCDAVVSALGTGMGFREVELPIGHVPSELCYSAGTSPSKIAHARGLPSRPARSWMNCQATRPEREPRVIDHSPASALSCSGGR